MAMKLKSYFFSVYLHHATFFGLNEWMNIIKAKKETVATQTITVGYIFTNVLTACIDFVGGDSSIETHIYFM